MQELLLVALHSLQVAIILKCIIYHDWVHDHAFYLLFGESFQRFYILFVQFEFIFFDSLFTINRIKQIIQLSHSLKPYWPDSFCFFFFEWHWMIFSRHKCDSAAAKNHIFCRWQYENSYTIQDISHMMLIDWVYFGWMNNEQMFMFWIANHSLFGCFIHDNS